MACSSTYRNLFVVLCTVLVLVVSASAQCLKNADGTVNWGTLPSLGSFKSNSDYENDDERRSTLSDLARGFVHMVTSESTVSELLDHLADLFNKTTISPWPEFQALAAILVGMLICLSVGIAYIVLVIVIGIVFGCCRCCNKCGGKRVQEESRCPGCLRVFYTVALLCVTGILCAGMAYTNFSNDFIGHTTTKMEPVVNDVIHDAQTFTSGTLKQMEYLIDDEYDQMDCHIRNDIDNIGSEIADPLVAYLRTDAGVQEAMDAFTALISDLDQTHEAFNSIQSNRMELIDKTEQLKNALTCLKRDLENITCTADCWTSTEDLDKVSNYSSLPEMDKQSSGAAAAKKQAEDLYAKFEEALNNISRTIKDNSKKATDDVKKLLDDTKETVGSSFDSISEAMNEFNSTVKDVQSTVSNWMEEVYKYDDYRYYGLIGVTCLTLLIVLFNIIGIVMGTFAYKDVLPTDRSRMSNAGGNVLIAGVFFSAIFGPILMLICSGLFATSGTVTLTCKPLNTLEIFEKTIDKPGIVEDGYYLGTLLFNNASEPLTFSYVLENCENDATAYSALKLDNLFSLMDIEKELDEGKTEALEELKKAIDIPELDLIPDDLDSQLDDAVDGIDLGQVDPGLIETVLNSSVTKEDLEAFAGDVKASTVNPSDEAKRDQIAAKLEKLQQDDVKQINNVKAVILDNVMQVVALNSTLPEKISDTINKSKEAENKVNLEATERKAQDIVVSYVDQVFSYAVQYLAQVEKQLEDEVAKCRPLRTAYDSGVDLFCYYALDSLNTLWFTTGWCAIFLIPSMFLAVRLAKFYRIMDEHFLPKAKKRKKVSSVDSLSSRGHGRRLNQDMAMDSFPDNGHTGHDNIRLVESIGQGGMPPQQNPHYIPDDVINGYDGYNNLGRPMAPPPAYNPDNGRWNMSSFDRREMTPVNTDSYNYGFSQDPVQQQNRDSVVRDLREYNVKPRVVSYL